MIAAARAARALAALCALAALAPGCAQSLVWYERSPDRRHRVDVLENIAAGTQRVRLDGHDGPSYLGIGVEALAWSPDGRRVAYPAQRSGGWRVVVAHAGDPARLEEGPRWEGLGPIAVAPSGLAYAAQRGARWHVVRDGRAGPPFDAILEGTLAFGPDGRRLAYAAQRGGATIVVVDGRQSAPYDAVSGLVFGDGGARVGFVGWRGDVAYAVIDGVEGPPTDGIAELVLAPRGRRHAYLALHDPAPSAGAPAPARPAWRAIVDGTAGPPFDHAAGLRFSPDGEHVAYAARRGAEERAVLDGAPGPPFEGVAPGTLAFAPRSDRLAYVALRDGAQRVVIAGVPDRAGAPGPVAEGPPFDRIDGLALAGARVGYIGRSGDRSRVILDGRASIPYAWASDLVFTPDGAHHAYLAQRGAHLLVARDGERTAVADAVAGTLVLDPGGRRWACLARYPGARRFYVVVDGVPRVPLDLDELVASLMRLPVDRRPLGRPDPRLLRRWVAAELALHPAGRR